MRADLSVARESFPQGGKLAAALNRAGVRTSLAFEWGWVAGRFLIVGLTIAGDIAFMRSLPVFSLVLWIAVAVAAYNTVLTLLLRRRLLAEAFTAGFILDNVMMLVPWWATLQSLSLPAEHNDLYLIVFPVLIIGVARLGRTIGIAYAAFWLAWLGGSTLYYYDASSYPVQQLPVRLFVLALSIGLTIRLVSQLQQERMRADALRREAEQRADRLEVMRRVGMALTATLDEKSVVDVVLREMPNIVPSDSAAIAMQDGLSDTMRVTVARSARAGGPDQIQQTHGVDLDGLIRVVKAGRVVSVPDLAAANHPDLRSAVERGYRALIGAPLVVSGEPRGALVALSMTANSYTAVHEQELAGLAASVAIALKNAQLYAELSAATQRYRSLHERMSDAVLVANHEGILIEVNEATCRLLGMDERALLGHPLEELVSREHQSGFYEALKRAVAGDDLLMEVDLLNAANAPVGVELHGAYIEAGNERVFYGIARDLSDRRRMQQHLVQSERLSAIGQLVSSVAHELNNPLTAVLGFAQLVQSSPPDASREREIRIIADQAARAARIVQNLLGVARRYKPEMLLTDIPPILDRIVELKLYDLRVRDIEVRREFDLDLPEVLADPHQMEQVFLNLLTNAEQALEESQTCGGRIVVTARQRDESLVVSISDNGPGIPPEHLRRIFEPFYTTKAPDKGTGLGLYICYNIVQEHGGRILVDTEVGQGATFTVELPLRAVGARAAIVEEPPEWAGPVSARVLVVDDEEALLVLLAQALSREGFAVATAGNGHEALELLRRDPFDLLLIDLRMPFMNGQELFKRIQSEMPHLVDRIMFLTGDTVSDTAQSFLETTGRPSLSKPIRIADLVRALRQAVSLSGVAAQEQPADVTSQPAR